jgi:two-component system, OmpR family, phosphate regulon sensor histidine kinase PhoR
MSLKPKTYSFLRIASLFGIVLLLILQLIWLLNTNKVAKENFIQQVQTCLKSAIEEELEIKSKKIRIKKEYDYSDKKVKKRISLMTGNINNMSEVNYVIFDYVKLIGKPVKVEILDSILNVKFKNSFGFIPKHSLSFVKDKEFILGKSTYIPYEYVSKYNYLKIRIGTKESVILKINSPLLFLLKLNLSIILFSLLIIILISIVLIFQYNNFKREKKFSKFIIDYTRMIAHDLQSPISSFRMLLQHFKANPNMEPSKLDEFCTMGMDHSDRILFSLNNLLFLATSENTCFNIHKTPTDISLIMEQVAGRIRRMNASDKVINLNIHYKPDRIFIPIDINLMENVFFNLLENAVKFSNEIVAITVVVIEEKNGYSLTIQDNGIGMTEEVQTRIFDIFDRGSDKAGSMFSGYGIGLSFVQKVVNAHGGTITVSSKPDWGSIFTLFLPKDY